MVLKSAFASMLILIVATISIFGIVPACVLFTPSVSFFFHSRQQRMKRKAEKQGGGGEEEATEKEKTEPAKALAKEEEEKTANDLTETGIKLEPKKPRKVRCKVCSKKLGLTGFSCRCDPENQFCALHRQDHGCTFDYNAQQRVDVALNNPLVKGE